MDEKTTGSGMLSKNIDGQELAHIRWALEEDIASGDVTAQLIPEEQPLQARIICRQTAVLCGKEWFTSVFNCLDTGIQVTWQKNDGDKLIADQVLCTLSGPARSILSGERTALNYLQTLSGTATRSHQYASVISDLPTRILDTRKTIPGLRKAQKYAVKCGGCHNHRIGLYDAFLIKENHIAAAGSITAAVKTAQTQNSRLLIEVEVENAEEIQEAIDAGCKRLLLDNFSPDQLRKAVETSPDDVKLEASGNITLENLREYAETGIDYLSIGALTKDLQSVDFSMRFIE